MVWYILSVILVILGILYGFKVVGNWFDELWERIISLILTVVFFFLSYNCWNRGLKQDTNKCTNYNIQVYNKQVNNKQYKEQLGVINNISFNSIILKNDSQSYYLNKDSEIRNFNNFKPGDKVDIYYVVNGYDCNIVISIKKIN